MEENAQPSIAQIKGKTTPFGFNVNLLKPIQRNAYLAANFDNNEYILGLTRIWNDKNGYQASVSVIGVPPLTPFPLDTQITLATEQQIKHALGLHDSKEENLNLGNLIFSTIPVNISFEKLGRVFITGKSGSGKSYTVGVIIEELIKKKIPVIIIDRHGEYSTLKILNKDNIPEDETYFKQDDGEIHFARNIIEFGDSQYCPHADLELEYLLMADLKDLVVSGQSIIMNLQGLDIPVQERYITQFCNRLYKASANIGEKIPPHYLFLDEAHLFAGKTKKDSVEILKLSAQEGRKFGHNLVIITQKPQLLDTTIRAQAGTWFIHKLTDVNDVRMTCNSAEGLSNDVEEEIQNLDVGEAIITGDITPYGPIRVQIRKRYTVHGGAGVNIKEFLENNQMLPKSDLVEKLRGQFSYDLLETTTEEIESSVKLSISELYHKLELLQKENLSLKQEIQDYQSRTSAASSTSNIDIETQLANLKESDSLPQPGELYDEKMLQIMEERDDLVLKQQELTKKYDKTTTQLQTLQLEISGIKVENETLKANLIKETQRAEESLLVAEKALKAMKKSKKR